MLLTRALLLAFASSLAGAFTPEAKYGKAVVVMSIGRGGSTWFCDVVMRASPGSMSAIEFEALGNDKEDMLKLSNPTKVAIEYLNSRRKHFKTGYVGFKMKPYVDNTAYDKLYRHFAGNKVKMLVLSRNPLDREISHDKHSEVKVDAHCLKTDLKCIQKHQATKPKVPVEHLISALDNSEKTMTNLYAKLNDFNVSYLRVDYDTFAFGCKDQKLTILQQILDFLYPKNGLKADMNILRSKYEYTSDRNQSSVVSNYAQVVALLKGTKYENLLRTADPPCP